MIHETFWTLLRDPAHWEFELFLMLLFDGLIFGLLWPFVRVHWRHHIRHDEADRAQDIDNAAIQHAMNQKLDVLSGRHYACRQENHLRPIDKGQDLV